MMAAALWLKALFSVGGKLFEMARGPAHGNGEEILEGRADLDADDVGRGARMIVIGFQHGAERARRSRRRAR